MVISLQLLHLLETNKSFRQLSVRASPINNSIVKHMYNVTNMLHFLHLYVVKPSRGLLRLPQHFFCFINAIKSGNDGITVINFLLLVKVDQQKYSVE